MKFRQLSFKTFQKSKSKKKKNKDSLPVEQVTQTTTTNINDNETADDNCNLFGNNQNTSLRCSLRRYKTSVTPRSKYVIQNRRSAVSDDEDESSNGLQYELDDIDRVLNSARKERTRIKTNPWIPPRKSFHEAELINLPEGADTEDYLNVCILAKEAGKTYISSESNKYSDRSTVTKRMKELGLSELNINRWSIISEGDVSLDLNSPTIEELNERFANIDYPIDFKYEDNIDNILDDEISTKQAKRLSIGDLLDDVSEDSSDTSNSSMEISDNNSCTGSDSSEGSMFNHVSNEMAAFSIHKHRMEESIDAGYSSLSRNSHFPSTSDSDSVGRSESESEEDLVNTAIVGKNCCDLEAHAACDSERSLPDIRNSLQEKVNQLRAEKSIVEEKIREAQEDDKIRQKETQRFRRHLPVYKKQVLMKTLNSLKERLESQSQRLQKSYSTVLAMQRRFAHRHNPFFMVPNSNLH